VELDRGKRRATIETGAMRVSVEVDDLGAADGQVPRARQRARPRRHERGRAPASARRNVPMSLDLRGARVDEALGALETLPRGRLARGPRQGHRHPRPRDRALRDAVRSDRGAHPLVQSVRAGERGEGGDGVTVVELG
jgi:DNA mismatch repair protein MutS2